MQQNDGVKRFACVCLLLCSVLAGAQRPESPPAPAAQSGAELYKAHCASCHGADGKGHVKRTGELVMNPGDLTRLSARNGGEFPDYRLRKMLGGEDAGRGHGAKKMPVWGSGIDLGQPGSKQAAERIERLIGHLKSLQAGGAVERK